MESSMEQGVNNVSGTDEPTNGTERTEFNSTDLRDLFEVLQEQEGVMFPNGGEIHNRPNLVNPTAAATLPPSTNATPNDSRAIRNSLQRTVTVQITEQPAPKALRFRYECEGRSAGSIPGVNSTADNKTFPSIRVDGYQGRAVVVVSCVTKDPPYRPHPHNLVGRDGCKKGVCTVEINSETMSVTFSNLGIQCVKKKDIEPALKTREEIRVDPYRTGFSHRSQPSSIDLNAVRLCFQVFLEGEHRGRLTVPLQPVVSDPIFDKKAMSDLVICKLSDCTASVAGGKEIILLCEKVAKEDISVRFYEEHNGIVVWDAYGDFQHTHVHKQVAIAFKTPKYRTLDITESVHVYVQLKRPSDGVTSESLPFELLPLDAGHKRKRQKLEVNELSDIYRHVQAQRDRNNQHRSFLNVSTMDQVIKTEPRDSTPSPYHLYGGQMISHPSPSPQTPSPAPSMHSPYRATDPTTLFSTINQQQQQQMSHFGEPSNLNPNYGSPTYTNYQPTTSQQLPHYSQTTQWNLSPSSNMLQHTLQQQQPQQMSPHDRVVVQHQQPPMNNLNSSSYNVDNLIQPSTSSAGGVGADGSVGVNGDPQQMESQSSANLENLLMDSQQDPNSLSNVSLSLFNAEQQLTSSFTNLSTGPMNDFNNL